MQLVALELSVSRPRGGLGAGGRAKAPLSREQRAPRPVSIDAARPNYPRVNHPLHPTRNLRSNCRLARHRNSDLPRQPMKQRPSSRLTRMKHHNLRGPGLFVGSIPTLDQFVGRRKRTPHRTGRTLSVTMPVNGQQPENENFHPRDRAHRRQKHRAQPLAHTQPKPRSILRQRVEKTAVSRYFSTSP